MRLLREACAAVGIAVSVVFWQDAGTDWRQYDAVSPLVAWTYPHEPELFLARLAEIEATQTVRLFNSAAVVRANMDKGYLMDLAAKGAPVPPTLSLPTCVGQVWRVHSSFMT